MSLIVMTVRLSYQTGYTLLELMVVVAMMAILVTMATVGFLSQLRQAEAQLIENALKAFLVESKQDALVYQNTVTSCVATDNQTCVLQDGNFLLSFIDKNNNQRFDSGDKLIKNEKLSLRFGRLVTRVALNRNYVELSPNTGNPIGYMGHIKYCPTNRNTTLMFMVSFNKMGLIKTKSNSEEPTQCP